MKIIKVRQGERRTESLICRDPAPFVPDHIQDGNINVWFSDGHITSYMVTIAPDQFDAIARRYGYTKETQERE